MYQITNRLTGLVVGKSKTLSRALKRADKLDNEYGAYIHNVKWIDTRKV